MESQEIYSDDSSYHSNQDSDYVYDSQGYYSDSSDSCDSSFIDDSELNDVACYFDDTDTVHIHTKYTIYFNEGNILEAEEELYNVKYNLRKPRITSDNILTCNIDIILWYDVLY